MSDQKFTLKLSEAEARLVLFWREFGFGDIILPVQNGVPMMTGIKVIRRKITDEDLEKYLKSDISSLL
jgi:hypothetical protein